MLDWIKEGELGMWRVDHFEITKDQATIYAIGCYGSYEIAPHPGKYTRLSHKNRGVIMSDTRQELYYLYDFKNMITLWPDKDVHISGLGLGICAKMALDLGRNVEVVEIDPDVISLVGDQLTAMYPKTLTIINADALEWRPQKGKRYGAVWHDIWDQVSLDNLEQCKLLMRRWGHWCKTQDYWGHDWMLKLQRDEREWR